MKIMKNKTLLAIITLFTTAALQAAPVEIDRVSAIVDDSIIMKSELDYVKRYFVTRFVTRFTRFH